MLFILFLFDLLLPARKRSTLDSCKPHHTPNTNTSANLFYYESLWGLEDWQSAAWLWGSGGAAWDGWDPLRSLPFPWNILNAWCYPATICGETLQGSFSTHCTTMINHQQFSKAGVRDQQVSRENKKINNIKTTPENIILLQIATGCAEYCQTSQRWQGNMRQSALWGRRRKRRRRSRYNDW